MRLFAAVGMAPDLAKAVKDIQKKLDEPALFMVNPENMHLTLKFLGEVDESRVKGIEERLGRIMAEPFEIEYSGIGAFPSADYARVVWIGTKSEGLYKLAEKIRKSLPEFPNNHPFSAHLTIARVRFSPERLKDNLRALERIKVGKQTVNGFALKESTLTKEGPVYKNIRVFSFV